MQDLNERRSINDYETKLVQLRNNLNAERKRTMRLHRIKTAVESDLTQALNQIKNLRQQNQQSCEDYNTTIDELERDNYKLRSINQKNTQNKMTVVGPNGITELTTNESTLIVQVQALTSWKMQAMNFMTKMQAQYQWDTEANKEIKRCNTDELIEMQEIMNRANINKRSSDLKVIELNQQLEILSLEIRKIKRELVGCKKKQVVEKKRTTAIINAYQRAEQNRTYSNDDDDEDYSESLSNDTSRNRSSKGKNLFRGKGSTNGSMDNYVPIHLRKK